MRVVSASRVRDEEVLLPWLVANLTHVDEIHLADGGSTDRSIIRMAELAAVDARIKVSVWPKKVLHFFDQEKHMRFTFEQAFDGGADWLYYADADEIASIALQEGLREWLHAQAWPAKTCVTFPFYSTAPGWLTHYSECYGMLPRMWNWVPAHIPGKGYPHDFEPPNHVIPAPPEMLICHFNWAMARRFARKRVWYERWRGYPSWHPDEKFKMRALMPRDSLWHSPTGEMVGPQDMVMLGEDL